MEKLSFKALKETKFLLQSEMIDRSEDTLSATSSLEACNACWEGLELKLFEYCRVESLANEWRGQFVEERSFMNKREWETGQSPVGRRC